MSGLQSVNCFEKLAGSRDLQKGGTSIPVGVEWGGRMGLVPSLFILNEVGKGAWEPTSRWSHRNLVLPSLSCFPACLLYLSPFFF